MLLIADAVDFAKDVQDVSPIDVLSPAARTTIHPPLLFASVDMKLMEILMVFVIEFATGACVAMASS